MTTGSGLPGGRAKTPRSRSRPVNRRKGSSGVVWSRDLGTAGLGGGRANGTLRRHSTIHPTDIPTHPVAAYAVAGYRENSGALGVLRPNNSRYPATAYAATGWVGMSVGW